MKIIIGCDDRIDDPYEFEKYFNKEDLKKANATMEMSYDEFLKLPMIKQDEMMKGIRRNPYLINLIEENEDKYDGRLNIIEIPDHTTDWCTDPMETGQYGDEWTERLIYVVDGKLYFE